MPEPWLILRSQAKKERILVIQLLRIGFDAWLLEVKHWRFRVGKRENITKVLIPCYVFARTKEAISVDKFNLPGSRGLLIQDAKPALLSHDDAMNLNRLCSLDLATEITTNFSCGQQITIDSWPLKGISGKGRSYRGQAISDNRKRHQGHIAESKSGTECSDRGEKTT